MFRIFINKIIITKDENVIISSFYNFRRRYNDNKKIQECYIEIMDLLERYNKEKK